MNIEPKTKILEVILKGFFSLAGEIIKKYNQNPKVIESNLECHMTELVNWSGNIQIYGMSRPKNTDCDTIKLMISQNPRKFKGINNDNVLDEISLFNDLESCMLLGDPGSGKTTTLKRIVRNMILSEKSSDDDLLQYPILIRLRDINNKFTLHYEIAKKIGLSCSCDGKFANDQLYELNNSTILIGDKTIEEALPDLLNNSKALILLDGLDEVNINKRYEIEKEIIRLSNRLWQSKVIVSCRSGGYINSFEGFNIVEICPLSAEQIKQIVDMWADNPEDFLSCLNDRPYNDLVNRPLFLVQLVIIFNHSGYLPEQPASVCKKIINLMLEEWDERRTIQRSTKYANFESERKLDFLSALSTELTVKKKKKVFTTDDLIDSYRQIYRSFNLPENEAKKVANEIETHTGIIIESGLDNYEFSHLSLQEYLCAYYIVRESASENARKYLVEYPSPVAIAVSISSDPSMWLGTLILNENSLDGVDSHQFVVFIYRLIIERPNFNPKLILGLAILNIYFHFSPTNQDHVFRAMDEFVSLNGVDESVAMAIALYKQEKTATSETFGYCYLRNASGQPTSHGVTIPNGGFFPINLLGTLCKKFSIKITD